MIVMPNVADNEKNIELCKKNCITCPTHQYNNLGGTPPELLFCSRGKSDKPIHEIKDEGCNCPACPVFIENELSGGWFCMYGTKGRE